MLVVGTVINDRYEIQSFIGDGGMANVYLARDKILNRDVALKMLRGDLAQDERFVRRFQREALSASSLSHPNIVEVYDVGEEDGKYYIVMEYLCGKTLKQIIKDRGKISVIDSIDIMKQLASGLEHAHNYNIVHRDIKPQNIVVLEDGTCKITDFGIAVATNAAQLTQTNSVMGSVHYLAPEAVSGSVCNEQTDIYALGILLYELLSGELPFTGDQAVNIAMKQIKETMPRITDKDKLIPQSIENIIIRATMKSRELRYRNSSEFLEDLTISLDLEHRNAAPLSPNEQQYYDGRLEKTKIMKPITEKDRTIIRENVIEEQVRSKRRFGSNSVLKALISILGLLIILLVAAMLVIPYVTRVKETTVPNVVGLTPSEAEILISDANLYSNLTIQEIYSDYIDEGLIVKTSPFHGKIVKEDTEVVLYISLGTKKIELDSYVGQNKYIAMGKLEALGFEVHVQEIIGDENSEKDIIMSQFPVANSLLDPEHESITLYIPLIVEKYPDMVADHYTALMVQEFSDKYDLILNFKYEYSDTIEKGYVIQQNRPYNSTIVKGAPLTVVISDGKKPIEEDKN